MPVLSEWNADTDCDELSLTLPIGEKEIRELGFPAGACAALNGPGAYVERVCRALPRYSTLALFVRKSIESQGVSLVKERPESDSRRERFFLSFGVEKAKESFRETMFIQLGLPAPDWRSIEQILGFTPGEAFVEFAESFPGLLLDLLEVAPFLCHPKRFANVEPALPRTCRGRVGIPTNELTAMKKLLYFQTNYYSVHRFIGQDGRVCETDHRRLYSLVDTGLTFSEWSTRELEAWAKRALNGSSV